MFGFESASCPQAVRPWSAADVFVCSCVDIVEGEAEFFDTESLDVFTDYVGREAKWSEGIHGISVCIGNPLVVVSILFAAIMGINVPTYVLPNALHRDFGNPTIC